MNSAVRVRDLIAGEVARRLRGQGLHVAIGPFVASVTSNVPELVEQLLDVYSDYPLADDQPVCDIHARVENPVSLRRWIRPKVFFHLDDQTLFSPMPRALALPMLEWGINWAIAMRSHQYLMRVLRPPLRFYGLPVRSSAG